MTKETVELLQRAQAGDRSAEERLLLQNMGLIRCVEHRFYGRGIEPDDLHQLGCLGFLKAVRCFDLACGTALSTYAVPKIIGEIRRFLRDNQLIRLGRTLQEHSTKVRWARNQLSVTLNREPTIDELAIETGISAEEIAVCDLASCPIESAEQIREESGDSVIFSTESFEETIVIRQTLKQEINSLPERIRQVMTLRYFHELTQMQTARILQVSQVQISRLEQKGIYLLRSRMTTDS